MFPDISGSTLGYLADLNQTQQQITQTSTQISSGLRVQQASDDP
jgi:flagellin-like hook-associated protein FlgL